MDDGQKRQVGPGLFIAALIGLL